MGVSSSKPPPSHQPSRQRARQPSHQPSQPSHQPSHQRSQFDVTEAREAALSEIKVTEQVQLVVSPARNVLLIGRSRLGKSTFGEVLKDFTYEPSSFSETERAVLRCFSLGDHAINVIDTPGRWFDDTDQDKFLLRLIKECLALGISQLHCVIIFVTVTHGVTAKELQTIELLLREFVPLGLTPCLCVSHAESFSTERRTAVLKELKMHRQVADLIESHDVQIIFSGCVNPNDSKYTTKDQLKAAYREVSRMRSRALETIFGANNFVSPLVSLAKFNTVCATLAFRSCNFLKHCLEEKTDFAEKHNAQALDNHVRRMHNLRRIGPYLTDDGTLAPLLTQLDQSLAKLRVARVSLGYSKRVLAKMVGPFAAPPSDKKNGVRAKMAEPFAAAPPSDTTNDETVTPSPKTTIQSQ